MIVIKRITIPAVLIGLLLLFCGSAEALTAQIFTDAKHQVSVQGISQNVKVEYYNLDQLQAIVAKINAAIQGEGHQAAANQAKQIMSRYRMQLNHAVDGVKYVHQYKIKSIPTIVFDSGKYRVVGQNNLGVAIEEYKKWESNKK